MNESEYRKEIELLSEEIETAISVFYTYEEINRLLAEDQEILKTLNREPLFWKVQAYCLQTTLLIVLGRIFDKNKDSHSIHKVINATLGNVKFFSKQALGERKIKKNGGTNPEWLEGYLASAWEPSGRSDLEHLETSLQKHQKQFEDTYRPIRNKVFAHKGLSDPENVFGLFKKTSRKEIAGILDFLHNLIKAITHLYENGAKPELCEESDEKANQQIRCSAEKVLRTLTKGYACQDSKDQFRRPTGRNRISAQ